MSVNTVIEWMVPDRRAAVSLRSAFVLRAERRYAVVFDDPPAKGQAITFWRFTPTKQ